MAQAAKTGKNILYFDCCSGAAGDMILASLVDLGLNLKKLKTELAKVDISGYGISRRKIDKGSISASRLNISIKKSGKNSSSHHHSKLATPAKIINLINKSSLSDKVKCDAVRIFERLSEVETDIHGGTMHSIHFHEIADIDSVLDIVGAVIAFDMLGVEKVYYGPVFLGTGNVDTKGGILPVPSPATLSLLKGKKVVFTHISQELMTPTAAAILTVMGEQVSSMPLMQVLSVGYGAGTRDIPGVPNVLRTVLCAYSGCDSDEVTVIETNIDDTLPMNYEFVIDELFKAGALDVFISQGLMKKSRPAVALQVICDAQRTEPLSRIIFKETTTLGVRIYTAVRRTLQREVHKVNTIYGKISVKIAFDEENAVNVMPEYEEVKACAVRTGIAFKKVYAAALAQGIKKSTGKKGGTGA